MSEGTFEMPILGLGRGNCKGYPFRAVKIPLSCEAQAKANHSQTLSRLRERGGMGPEEICCILDGKDWTEWRNITIPQTIERLKDIGIPV